jgi:hypothetical protein
VSDIEAVRMAHFILYNEGLFLGSSAAMNCCGVVKMARNLPKGSTVVTILCDSGMRHLSKFWSVNYLLSYNIFPSELYKEEERDPSIIEDNAETGDDNDQKRLVVDRDAVLAMRIQDVVL